MVKRTVAGIQVPSVATSEELRLFVHQVYLALDENCLAASKAIGVNAATIWKLEEGEQNDSQVVRDSLGIRRTPVRPREWMPTNNIEAAVGKLLEHYDLSDIIEALAAASGKIESVTWRTPIPVSDDVLYPDGVSDATPLSASVNWIP